MTGYSGGFFVDELERHGYGGQIRCVVRETSDTSVIDNSDLQIERAVGDLTDREFMNQAMSGVDTVLHVASIFHSFNVVEAALSNNVRRMILVHTTGIYSKYKSASSEYRRIESDIEKLVSHSASDVGLVYLRPTMIFGHLNDRNVSRFIGMVNFMRVFPLVGRGMSLVQPVHGRDLGSAYYQVLSTPTIMSGDYVLSGDRPLPLREMLQLVSGFLGKKTYFVPVPLWLSVLLARCLKVCTLGAIDYVERVQRMGEDRSFSHDNASRDFGYEPMPFNDGLRAEVRLYTASRAGDGPIAPRSDPA
jgi:nucleoside-diphosphate-sugar epimerase